MTNYTGSPTANPVETETSPNSELDVNAEYERFERLARGLVRVPKDEIVEKRS